VLRGIGQRNQRRSGVFRIKNIDFQVEKATLYFEIRHPEEAKSMWGSSSQKISWFVEIQGQPREIESDTWQPIIFCQFCPNTLSKWVDLEGISIDIEDSYREETQNYHGGLFVFSHEKISKCHFSFGTRHGNHFDFRWQGLGDIYEGVDEFESNIATVPFEIATSIHFTGGTVYDHKIGMARRMLNEFLEPHDFIRRQVPLSVPIEDDRPMGYISFEAKSIGELEEQIR
jgi:hypothetical protein